MVSIYFNSMKTIGCVSFFLSYSVVCSLLFSFALLCFALNFVYLQKCYRDQYFISNYIHRWKCELWILLKTFSSPWRLFFSPGAKHFSCKLHAKFSSLVKFFHFTGTGYLAYKIIVLFFHFTVLTWNMHTIRPTWMNMLNVL